MKQFTKIVSTLILFLIALRCNYGQDKSALKYIDEINFKVEIAYLSGNDNDYKWLLLFKSGIIAEALHMLDSAGIQVNDDIATPILVLRVTADNNFNYKSPGDEGWYYVAAEIYLIDKVKLIDHPGNRVETIIWHGDSIRKFISEQNVDDLRNENLAQIVKSFINDFLEINSD